MTVRVRLVFPEHLVRQPVLANVARRFDVVPNVRRANVEENSGWIVCELDGSSGALDAAMDWLKSSGVEVELLGDVVEG